MREVAIIGAGELGGSLAHLLARRNLVSRIRLVDAAGAVAVGKALDIMQAAPNEGFATGVSGASDLYSAAGADLIVIADGARADSWQGDDGFLLLRRVSECGSRSPILCAGSAHRELVERGCRELKISTRRLFGSAPGALAAALRALVALEIDGSALDVALTVLGVPPARIVVPWEDATIAGIAASRVLDAQARRRLAARVALVWPPGPHALAAAAVQVIEGMVGRSRQMASCFVAPDDSAGVRTRAAALTVALDGAGIARVEIPALNAHDQVAFDNATMI